MQQAEDHAKEAMESLKRAYNLIEESVLDAPAHIKAAAKRNVRKILDDVDEAKMKYTDELQKGDIAERYWKQLRTARENFKEELQILFPNINIHDKKLSVSEDAFDLFVLHMYHKVHSLQNELEKLRVRCWPLLGGEKSPPTNLVFSRGGRERAREQSAAFPE